MFFSHMFLLPLYRESCSQCLCLSRLLNRIQNCPTIDAQTMYKGLDGSGEKNKSTSLFESTQSSHRPINRRVGSSGPVLNYAINVMYTHPGHVYPGKRSFLSTKTANFRSFTAWVVSQLGGLLPLEYGLHYFVVLGVRFILITLNKKEV